MKKFKMVLVVFLSAVNLLLTVVARLWLLLILIIAMYLLWEGIILGSTDGTVMMRIVGIRYLFYEY